MKKKLQLDNVTLVTVSSINIPDTIDALLYNLRGIDFGAVKFISHEKPTTLPDFVTYGHCEKICNLDDYSGFMLYELHKYIDTQFCLSVQQDGVVLHPGNWKPEFLEYDYIGAPWPIDKAFQDSSGRFYRVGNGGFSLRSKKLLRVASEEHIPFESSNGSLHEDTFMCIEHRQIYESKGIRFADIDIAKFFAHEMRLPEIRGIKPFGFHKYRKQNRWYPRFPSVWTKFKRKSFSLE